MQGKGYMLERLMEVLISIARPIIEAIIIVLIGCLIGIIAKAGIKLLFDRVVYKLLGKTTIGVRLKEAKIELGGVIGTFVFVFVIAQAIMLAVHVLRIPDGAFVVEFIRVVVNILGGLLVLVIGIPLATICAEYLAKLITLPLRDRHEAFEGLASTILSVIFILFVFGLALAIMFGIPTFLQNLTMVLPTGVMTGVMIIVGYIIGDVVGKFVRGITEHLSKPIEETDIGRGLKDVGINIPILLGGVVKVSIIILSISIGLGIIGATGVVGEIIMIVVHYLPKVLGAIIILTLGLALVIILARYIGKIFRVIAKDAYESLAILVENLVALGLIAAFVAIALNILGLLGNVVYALIIGAIVIAVGIMITEVLIKLLINIHTMFERLAPLVGAIITLIFAYVGISAILLQIPGAAEVLKTVGWGIAIAFAVILIPIAFYFARTAWKESEAMK